MSACRPGLAPSRSSLIVLTFALVTCEALQNRQLSTPLPQWTRWRTAHPGSGRNILFGMRSAGDLRASADPDMPDGAGLATHYDKIT